MLYRLTQEQLSRTLLPLGNLRKAHVREIAARAGLSVAHKTDSQEICFVTEGSYADYIAKELGQGCSPEGNFVDEKGNEIECADMEINVEVPFEAITISDDLDASEIHGHIISLIYIGDHYEIMVRTDEEEDFILNSPDLWNENDEVSIIIDQSQIHLSRKGAKK